MQLFIKSVSYDTIEGEHYLPILVAVFRGVEAVRTFKIGGNSCYLVRISDIHKIHVHK